MGPETLVLGGRFKVLRHIGGGGMSEVYLAVQISLGRQVALKVLKRDLGKRTDMAERFRREALLLSTVEHPAVVRVIDFESTPEANVLVLELAEGDTLETVLKNGPMPYERAVPVLAQLAEGLAAIHEKGIIHRDIKPQNVVLTPTARGEQARLLDFGIARLIEINEGVAPDLGPLPDNPMISHPGQVVGTPAFVAPEQALAKPLDARTDVYAFGVLAFRLLSGEFPFPGPGSNDFLRQHITQAPRRIDAALPALAKYPELVNLVMQCLEKSPDARPANAQALYERLMRMMPQSPYESSVTTPSRRVIAPGAPAGGEQVPGPQTSSRWTVVQQRMGTFRRAWRKVTVAALRRMGRVSPEWRRSLLVVAGLCLVAPAVWAMWPPTPTERAAQLIALGRPEAALALLDQRLTEATWETPELFALKAAALHRLARENDERDLLRANPYQTLHAAHPLLLDSLAEDFARKEDDVELIALLKVVPEVVLQPYFENLSTGPGSERQWGALRFLDTQQKDGVPRPGARYAASLTAKECYIRSAAAKHLAELKATDAIVALRALSETPKEKSEDGLKDCGQDDAAEAIRELKRE